MIGTAICPEWRYEFTLIPIDDPYSRAPPSLCCFGSVTALRDELRISQDLAQLLLFLFHTFRLVHTATTVHEASISRKVNSSRFDGEVSPVAAGPVTAEMA